MDSKRFSAWGDTGVLAAIFFGGTLIAGLCMAVAMASHPDMEWGKTLFITYTIQFSLAIAGGIVWLRRRDGARLRFGVRWSAAPSILWGVVLVTAASIALEPLLNLFPDHYLERLDSIIGSGGWALLTTVVAAPILEEIFFRGIVLEHLSRRWSALAAVAASSAIFGAAHLPILPQALNAFVISILLGYLYLTTRSLVPLIVVHAINNGLAYLTLELAGTQNIDTRGLIGNDAIYHVVYAASVVILAVSLVILVAKTNNKTPKTALHKEDE